MLTHSIKVPSDHHKQTIRTLLCLSTLLIKRLTFLHVIISSFLDDGFFVSHSTDDIHNVVSAGSTRTLAPVTQREKHFQKLSAAIWPWIGQTNRSIDHLQCCHEFDFLIHKLQARFTWHRIHCHRYPFLNEVVEASNGFMYNLFITTPTILNDKDADSPPTRCNANGSSQHRECIVLIQHKQHSGSLSCKWENNPSHLNVQDLCMEDIVTYVLHTSRVAGKLEATRKPSWLSGETQISAPGWRNFVVYDLKQQ